MTRKNPRQTARRAGTTRAGARYARPDQAALRRLLLDAPYPTRNVDDNLADLEAQVAANHQGARDLLELIDHYGLATTQAYMRHIQTAAETKMRAALAELPDGDHYFEDHLDDGSKIAVTLSIRHDQTIVDFAGTDGVLDGNLNANKAIVTAAVMYCMRCLIQEDIPLNQGVLAPIQLKLPAGLLNPPARPDPRECAAVAGGNVETSQRIVDVLLGALRVAAASQGTMNNVLFGDGKLGPAGIVKTLRFFGQLDDRPFSFAGAEQHETMGTVPVVLGPTIGGPRTIEFLDLLFTRDRIGNQIRSLGKEADQPVVSGVVDRPLNGRRRVRSARRVGRVRCLGHVEQAELIQLVAAVELGRKFGVGDIAEQHGDGGQ